MQKRVFIIHGCSSSKEKAMDPERVHEKRWILWLKKELAAQSFEVETPLMPESWAPDYAKFKRAFEKHEITEDSVLVGHSCGCAFLVRWLGETKQKVKKLIMVAPWKIAHRADGSDAEFYGFPIDRTIKERVGEIVMFTSNDEAEDGKKSLKIYQEALGGRVIDLPNHGHYRLADMGTDEFLEILEEIEKPVLA